jgi:nucleoside 2-deoxyribosyltransferase
MSNVYLAGGITGLSYEEATAWREEACKQFAPHGITGLSPLRHKTYLLGETSLADTYSDLNVMSTEKGITTRDRWDCQRSDVVLFNLMDATRVSIGTMIEIGWADSARRPIVLAMETGGLHDHAIVRACAGFIVPTLQEAIDTVITLLAPC